MYLGKKKCRVLRKVRQQIADANGISYNPHKCTHRGDCQGTCPACEQEMRQIEGEIRKRRISGHTAMVVGTAIGISALATGTSSCHSSGHIVGKVPAVEHELEGDVVAPSPDSTKENTVEAKKITPEEMKEILRDMPVQKHKHKNNFDS